MYKNLRWVIPLLLLANVHLSKAQNAVISSGGSFSGSGGSVSITVGETSTGTAEGTDGHVTLGVQQVEATLLTALDPAFEVPDVYPNPVTSRVTVRGLLPNARYELISQSGITMANGLTESTTLELDLVNIKPGMYLLSITHKNNPPQVIQIFKN